MTKPRLSRVTTKGQVTIPVEVGRALRLRPGDRVAFDLKKGEGCFPLVEATESAGVAMSMPFPHPIFPDPARVARAATPRYTIRLA